MDNEKTTVHVNFQRYGCAIMLHNRPFYASDATMVMIWEGLPFATYSRYKWYFRYRAALIQVQHPKQFVEIRETRQSINAKEAEQILVRNKIVRAKADITKIENAITKYTALYQPTIFEPTFQDTIAYKKAADKLDQIKLKLQNLTNNAHSI